MKIYAAYFLYYTFKSINFFCKFFITRTNWTDHAYTYTVTTVKGNNISYVDTV